MSKALVKISGTVANTIIWTPQDGQKGKPVLKIDLLQITGLGSHIQTIKDEDLNAIYVPGQFVELECTLSLWAMDGGKRHGATLQVYRGITKQVKMDIGDEIPLGQTDDHKKSAKA